MPIGDFNPYSKATQLKSRRIGNSQRQMGDISTSVDKDLKARSKGYCEIGEKCIGSSAVVRCHTIGRRIIPNKTTVDDLFHGCTACHTWLDETAEGIRFKRKVRIIGTTAYLRQQKQLARG
jgi:hypothetical protein